MYLKEINSHGFKSFADKTVINLPSDVAAVVGPNGSGKSNIVDAVRWVLGEQSIKSLRGDGNMSDVIFSGSDSRKPMNHAKVSLTFCNKDRHINMDNDEIIITRMIYKSGDNEYFINNKSCRLKDITDLLLDSGIARESFNIISQGEIAKILSSKPQERRMIFEEAAGVLKYKKRKEEAVRKLKVAKENSDRLNDIIKEVESRLIPLEKQSKKALEYTNYKKELSDIEIALCAYEIDLITKELELCNKKIEELSTVEELNASLSSEESKLVLLKNTLDEIDRDINLKQKDIIEYEKKIEKLNSNKRILVERKNLDIDDKKLYDDILILKDKELKFESEYTKLDYEILELNNEVTKLQENIQSLNKEEQELSSNYNNNLFELNKKIKEKANLENEISIKMHNIENNAHMPSSVKSVLNNPKLNVIGTVSKLISFDELYADAINFSLGPAVNYIVVEDKKDASLAIDYLKNNNLGRATFLPINELNKRYIAPDTLNKLKTNDGFINNASSLVKYDMKYENVISNLLGNVIIARNIEDASIISNIADKKYKVVTLDGSVISTTGSMTGGYANTNNTLKDKYQLDNLRKGMSIVLDEISKYESIQANLLDSLEKIRLKTTEATKLKDNAFNNILSKKELRNYYEKELEIIKEDVKSKETNNHHDDELKIMDEIYSAEYKLFEIKKEYEKKVNEKELTKDLINSHENGIKNINSIINQNNRLLSELNLSKSKYDSKLDNLLGTLTCEYNITYERALNNYILNMPAEIARESIVTLKRNINALGPVNLDSIIEYEEVKERFDHLSSQEKELTGAIDNLNEIINQLDETMKEKFITTFRELQVEFTNTFTQLFNGGNASLSLTDENDILNTGIEIVAMPPGKKLSSISLLSGGEKTLTTIALLFSIIKIRNTPFCILDEIEAALDDANVILFGKFLDNFRGKTQFILITHKKKTMEYANCLYGITMQESGVSKLVSVKLSEIPDDYE